MYRVLTDFSDLQDKEHVYRAGDEFPRLGLSVTEERIKELTGFSNRRNRPLIELVKSEDSEKSEKVAEKLEEKLDENRSESINKAEFKPIPKEEGQTPAKVKRSRKKALKRSDNGTGSE